MMYSPAVPDGTNASLDSAVSPDGRPEAGITYRVPPRCGVAGGEQLTIRGAGFAPSQEILVRFWCFAQERPPSRKSRR